MELLVGSDSSWSVRALICLAICDIQATTIPVALTGHNNPILREYSPAGLVPVLKTQEGVIHDSLAIAEYANERSGGKLYPENVLQRAQARSLCSELHSGFTAIRSAMPLSLSHISRQRVASKDIDKDIVRLTTIFQAAQLPFMWSAAGAVDAFYSVMALRLESYGILLQGRAGEYQKSLLNWDLLQSAIAEAKSWAR